MSSTYKRSKQKAPIKYVGETKNQLRHGRSTVISVWYPDLPTVYYIHIISLAGHGVYIYENRFFRYEGQWENGRKHGKHRYSHEPNSCSVCVCARACVRAHVHVCMCNTTLGALSVCSCKYLAWLQEY